MDKITELETRKATLEGELKSVDADIKAAQDLAREKFPASKPRNRERNPQEWQQLLTRKEHLERRRAELVNDIAGATRELENLKKQEDAAVSLRGKKLAAAVKIRKQIEALTQRKGELIAELGSLQNQIEAEKDRAAEAMLEGAQMNGEVESLMLLQINANAIEAAIARADQREKELQAAIRAERQKAASKRIDGLKKQGMALLAEHSAGLALQKAEEARDLYGEIGALRSETGLERRNPLDGYSWVFGDHTLAEFRVMAKRLGKHFS